MDAEKDRYYVLSSRFQIGLLSDGEKEELNRLQKKLFGDSILYREADYEKLACDPKKGESLPVDLPVESEIPPEAVEPAPTEEDELAVDLFNQVATNKEKPKKEKVEFELEEL